MLRLESVISGTKVEPRPYQRRIVNQLIDLWTGNYKNGAGEIEPIAQSVLVESPTGSGKTVMGLVAAKVLKNVYPDLTIGWVAMRRNLLAQAASENTGKGLNVDDIHFVSMFDKYPQRLVDAKQNGGRILLVMDEAQHDAANSCAHLHNIINPDFVLGMTATPFRTDSVKLCFSKVLKDAGIHQLIQEGYLSPYEHFTIPAWTVQGVADAYCAEPDRWGKSIAFFVNLEQCFQFYHLLRDKGIAVDVVTGSSDREQQLEDFANGKTRVLVNCMVLTEGFDCPDLQTAFVRDSGKGPTMQMGGRVFRKHPALAVKQIVQSKGTHWPFLKTALPKQQWLLENGEWFTLQINPKIDLISQNTRMAVAASNSELPMYIKKRLEKKPKHWGNRR